MTQTIECRFCDGIRPHNGTICLGCGMPIENAEPKKKKKAPASRPKCPKCRTHQNRGRADGTRICDNCGAWFDQT